MMGITRPSLQLALIVLCVSLGAGCLVGRVWMVDYSFDSTALRVHASEEIALATSQVGDEVDLLATDERARFAFRVAPGRIQVSVENRGPEPLSLNFADAAYVDANRKTHGLHVFVDDALLQDPAMEVLPDATMQFSLWPKDWSHGWHDGRPAIWRGDSPLGGTTIEGTSREKALANRREDVGKSFEIVLPLGTRHERTVYRFQFTVLGLVARRTSWA